MLLALCPNSTVLWRMHSLDKDFSENRKQVSKQYSNTVVEIILVKKACSCGILDQTCFCRLYFQEMCPLHETSAPGKTLGSILPCATVSVCEQDLLALTSCYFFSCRRPNMSEQCLQIPLEKLQHLCNNVSKKNV